MNISMNNYHDSTADTASLAKSAQGQASAATHGQATASVTTQGQVSSPVQAPASSESGYSGSGSSAAEASAMTDSSYSPSASGEARSQAIMQALQSFGLKSDELNTALAESLLRNNMAVSSENLHMLRAQSLANPKVSPDVLALMDRNNIPVNSYSASQMQAFLSGRSVFLNDLYDLADSVGSFLEANDLMPGEGADIPAGSSSQTAFDSSETSGIPGSANSQINTQANPETVTGTNSQLNPQTNAASHSDTAFPAGSASQAAFGSSETAGIQASEYSQLNPQANAVSHSDTAFPAGSASQAAFGSSETAGTQASEYSQLNPQTNAVSHSDTAFPAGSASQAAFGSSETAGIPGSANSQINSQTNSVPVTGAGSPGSINSQAAPGQVADNSSNAHANPVLQASAALQAAPNDLHTLSNYITSLVPSKYNGSEQKTDQKTGRVPLSSLIREALSLKPADINQKELTEWFRRTDKLLKTLSQATEKTASEDAQKSESLHKQTLEVIKSFRALENINRVFPCAVIPLHMKDKNAEADIYVYSDKKRARLDPEKCTALLHLSMPNLGPTDILLRLNGKKLSTSFTAEASASSLLEKYSEKLAEALGTKGFELKTEFNVAETKTSSGENDLEKYNPPAYYQILVLS